MLLLKNINKDYFLGNEAVHALKNISFNIDKGEFVAIIGASGSGKSTLMNVIGCLDVPSSGEYYLDENDVMSMNDNKLAELRNNKIGFVFQSFNLLAKLTVYENVELPLIYRGITNKERNERCMKSIDLVGLTNRINHKPTELSGGQQQRTAIARAIVGDPEIILADEPTGNLDSKSGKEVMKVLIDLNNRGKTIILITHDISLTQYASRILKISDGELCV